MFQHKAEFSSILWTWTVTQLALPNSLPSQACPAQPSRTDIQTARSASMPSYFSVPIFFVIFREAIEAAIIISVLVTLIAKLSATSPQFASMAKALYRQVVLGTLAGLFLSLAVGAVVLYFWYTYAVNLWAKAELLWEGIFSIVASLMVAATALAMLKGSRLYEKYQTKLSKQFNANIVRDSETVPIVAHADSLADHHAAAGASSAGASSLALCPPMCLSSRRWLVPIGSDVALFAPGSSPDATASASGSASGDDSTDSDLDETQADAIKSPLAALFWLPFITMLREGLEAVVFIGGVSLGEEPSAIPIAALTGIALGALIGVALHFSGSRLNFHYFFVVAACFLLLIADGLLVRGIGNLEDYVWSAAINLEADDVGTGAFDPRRNVWHLDCCSPENKAEGGWGIFSSLLGWRNNATISTISMYIVFWVLIASTLAAVRYSSAGYGSTLPASAGSA
ncbi:iron permease FTR1 family-domain-containing protein [Entophlyctis helioformis]|nr:iron permease FTR1 family-domain-containing protein [Entophlyctis helioformis]